MSSPSNSSPTPIDRILNSQFTRFFIIGFLILLLQIPTLMLFGLVNDRQKVRQAAVEDITGKWGKQQVIVGPRLLVPYIKRTGSAEKKNLKSVQKVATFLPNDLNIAGKMQTEKRHRGIFQVPVYTTDLTLSGQFEAPDFSAWGVQKADIQWNRAELMIQISDTRAISDQVNVKWNKATVPFDPGLGKLQSGGKILSLSPIAPSQTGSRLPKTQLTSINSGSGIHARLNNQLKAETKSYQFSIPLQLRGSESMDFIPMGKLTQVHLDSDWANPSFQGNWLPEKPEVTKDGFKAKWQIPFLGRNFPQQWSSDRPIADDVIYKSSFGVDLFSPVDNYHMAERSIKYNFLFLVLTFAVLWLFEVTAGLRVHPLQYLMVGVAMSMFYLLQLAISEHLGFHYAYAIASFAVVLLITGYTMSVLRAKRRGGIVGVMQVCLYSYLYVVLASQDYSLLLGSIGLFGFLAIVMFLTRRIDWFNPSGTQPRLEGD
ncbi:cell envelope integrity protein CreD [filamentous cyanobacterium LEGE 11480]|uniref:Cell envelope integrity protein CreD n=1 Tax=Romeriopsis navalis LEGE 11480 TaxID=2777977 RepID=A0A928VL14_9CYAN|nr:cell envelope integrity protein CreD [Romeriopsis navalis]MBE9030553.1 cell envelope integrity protein CreD [Romeriopsis navalis LEGE 11480]